LVSLTYPVDDVTIWIDPNSAAGDAFVPMLAYL
jgi:hypothetical protein